MGAKTKSFKNNPALSFISAHEDTQEATHEVVPKPTKKTVPEAKRGIAKRAEAVQENISEQIPRERHGYVRTQGRKGFKKPRINMAFDSDAFLDEIRKHSEKQGISITQFVNEAAAFYIDAQKKSDKAK